MSLALAGLVLVSLIVFLLWRLGRCCFSRCCSQPSKPVDPYRVLCNPWLTYHKVHVHCHALLFDRGDSCLLLQYSYISFQPAHADSEANMCTSNCLTVYVLLLALRS